MAEERFTPLTSSLRDEIKRAASLEGGIEPASRVWGFNERSITRIVSTGNQVVQKAVSLSWLDKFCIVSMTEIWVSDFPWYTAAELRTNGLFRKSYNGGPRPKQPIRAKCAWCGKPIKRKRQRVYCSELCYLEKNGRKGVIAEKGLTR